MAPTWPSSFLFLIALASNLLAMASVRASRPCYGRSYLARLEPGASSRSCGASPELRKEGTTREGISAWEMGL